MIIYLDLLYCKITISEQFLHKPNVMSDFFPIFSDLHAIVQTFLGTSLPHFGHFVMSPNP
jgi:hypothetical protein